jgi:hypothetical protein
VKGALNIPPPKFGTKKFVPSFSNSLANYTPPNPKHIFMSFRLSFNFLKLDRRLGFFDL